MLRYNAPNLCKAACRAVPGLFLALGCAAPRASFNGPLASAPAAYPATARAATATLPRPNRAARPDTRMPAAPFARGSDIGAAYRDRSYDRLDTSHERSVARFVAQPSQLFRPVAPERDWQYIVLHHSANSSGSLASIDRYHRETNGWDECGYHFVIGNGTESGDGEIEVGSRWPKQKHGAHTKPGNDNTYNERGIGVCLVGNFNDRQPTPKQIEAARRLVAYLQSRFSVPANRVITHGDVVGTHTECPGSHFPLDRILASPGFAAR